MTAYAQFTITVVSDGVDGEDAAIVSATEPEDKNRLWCDISVEPPVIKRWNEEKEEWEIINDQSGVIQQIYQNMYSTIEKSSDNVMIRVGEQTYLKDEIDRLIGDINTQYQQTTSSFEFKFNEFVADLGDLASRTANKFTHISKYIRFVDGAILIGIEGNPLTLRMQNDRISFLENGNEVAYISNRRLYITDAEVITSLTIGNFAFLPRNNGNLSFRKIRG